jgi:homoserine/homoserine lactone efflux protein
MKPETFLLYLATWTLVAVTPGPAVMCAVSQATRHGFRASLTGISGIQTGNILFFACIACGLAALLSEATTAFTVVRTVGAAYLVYLGVRIIASTFLAKEPTDDIRAGSPPVHRSLFLQGVLIQITNPKALLFVSALLPQFIQPERPVVPQLLVLVLATVFVDFVVLAAYAGLAERGLRSMKRARLAVWLERVFGTALIAFGFRLFASKR